MSVPDITRPDMQHQPGTPSPATIKPEQLTRTVPSDVSLETNDVDELNSPLSSSQYPEPLPPARIHRFSWYRIAAVALLTLGLLTAGTLVYRHAHQPQKLTNTSTGANLKQQTTSLATLAQDLKSTATSAKLTVNGQLAVTGSLYLMPSVQPNTATAGQLYYDKTVNLLSYYNGTAFIYLQGGGVTNVLNTTTNIGGNTTNIINAVGGGLGGSGTPGTISLFTDANSLGDSVIRQSGTNITVNGNTTITGTNSTAAFQVQKAGGTAVLTADTSNNVVVLGSDGASPTTTTLRGGAGVGDNVSGVNLVIAGSNGTGSANGGDIIFQTGQSPQGGIQLDNAGQTSSNSSTVTMSFTVGSQKDRLLVVSTDWTTSSVTFNGRPLTSLASVASAQHFGNGTYMEMWYLVNPPSGTFALTATAGGGGTAMGASSYYNVNQTTPFGTPVTATNSGDGPTTMTVSTSNTSQIVIDAMSLDRDSSSQNCTPTSGQVTRWSVVQQFFHVGCGSDIAATGSVMTLGWGATAADWVDVGVVVNPSVPGSTPLQQIGGSTPDTLFDRLHITAGGNVGINNNNPQYALDVNGTSNASVAMYSPVFDTASSSSLAIGNLNATSVQIGNTSSNIATSILGTVVVKPTPGNNSTAGFQIQDAGSTPLLTADTTSATITIAGSTNFATLSLSNTHLQSTQTSPPTTQTPSNCGTAPTANITSGATDTAGSLSITTGSGSPTTCDVTVSFDKPYATAPKSIITMPTVAVGGATNSAVVRISNVTTTSFTLQFAPTNATSSTTYSFYYLVIE